MSLANFNFLSPYAITIYALVALCFIIQLGYYLGVYLRVGRKISKKKKLLTDYPTVSIILCAENNIKDLQHNLPILLDQDYPNYEVVVVDMNSEDETVEYLEYMLKQHKNLYTSYISQDSQNISRKKLAQSIGIKKSSSDWLIFTEAYCQPTKQWVSELMKTRLENTEIILGYSKYEHKKSTISRLVAYDNIFTAMRFLGHAKMRKPYMGIGTNMAYKRSLFFEQKGYLNQLNLQRGEDELFINSCANSKNTLVANTADSVVEMPILEFKKPWKDMKIYHFTSMKRFRGIKHYSNSFDTITRLFFRLGALVTGVAALVDKQWIIGGVLLGMYLIHTILQLVITNYVLKKLGNSYRFYLSIIYYNYILPCYTLLYKLKTPRRKKGDILRF